MMSNENMYQLQSDGTQAVVPASNQEKFYVPQDFIDTCKKYKTATAFASVAYIVVFELGKKLTDSHAQKENQPDTQ